MKLLLLDIGNTYTKLDYYQDKIEYIDRIKSSELFDSFLSLNLSFDYAVISCVVKDLDIKISELIKNNYNKDCLIINHDLKYRVKYPKEKNELGSDLISLMESVSLKHDSFIVTSFGTASVFMVVVNREFVGCAIAPGVLTSLNGLINSASLIENTSLNGSYTLLGMDTNESLKSGIYNSFRYITDGYIKDIFDKYNEMPIYFFGGFKEILKDKSIYKDRIIIDDDLLFEGLLSIYKDNKEDSNE